MTYSEIMFLSRLYRLLLNYVRSVIPPKFHVNWIVTTVSFKFQNLCAIFLLVASLLGAALLAAALLAAALLAAALLAAALLAAALLAAALLVAVL